MGLTLERSPLGHGLRALEFEKLKHPECGFAHARQTSSWADVDLIPDACQGVPDL